MTNPHFAQVLKLVQAGQGRLQIQRATGLTQHTAVKLMAQAKQFMATQDKPHPIPQAALGEPALPPIDKEEIKFEPQGNTAEASYSGRKQISTLEELIEIAKIDLTIWTVENFVVNQWEMGFKSKSGDAQSWPLFQVKAWLRRRIPLAIELPEIHPIEIKSSRWSSLPKKFSTKIQRAFIWPDIQCGFKRDFRTGELSPLHDRRAIDVAVQVANAIKPDRHVFLGDNLDLPEWSDKYLVSPEFYWTTQPSAVELAWIYGQAKGISPDGQIDWILGNHEARMQKALLTYFKQAYQLRPVDDLHGAPLMSIERLLGVESLGIKLSEGYPMGEVWLGNGYRLSHGTTVRSQSGKTVATVTNDLRCNEGFGHIHRVESAAKTFWQREGARIYRAESFGTLASIKPGVVPSNAARVNWQQGGGWIDYEEESKFSHTTQFIIYDGFAVADGRQFQARSEAEICEHIQFDTKYDMRKAA